MLNIDILLTLHGLVFFAQQELSLVSSGGADLHCVSQVIIKALACIHGKVAVQCVSTRSRHKAVARGRA